LYNHKHLCILYIYTYDILLLSILKDFKMIIQLHLWKKCISTPGVVIRKRFAFQRARWRTPLVSLVTNQTNNFRRANRPAKLPRLREKHSYDAIRWTSFLRGKSRSICKRRCSLFSVFDIFNACCQWADVSPFLFLSSLTAKFIYAPYASFDS